MNLSAAIMLVNQSVRPVRVEYDPDTYKNNNPMKLFKTLDSNIVKDDLVIVPTGTRHGFTIAKVTEVDFAVDFSDPSPWGWIGGKFDKVTYDEVLKTEDAVKHKVAKASENKMRKELMEAAGLGEVDFSDVKLMAIPAPAKTSGGIAEAPPTPRTPPPRQYAPAPRIDEDDIPF